MHVECYHNLHSHKQLKIKTFLLFSLLYKCKMTEIMMKVPSPLVSMTDNEEICEQRNEQNLIRCPSARWSHVIAVRLDQIADEHSHKQGVNTFCFDGWK